MIADRLAAAFLSLCLFALPVSAQNTTTEPGPWRHGQSLMGDLKYPEGFTRFDYVNPDAPKGGTVRLSAFGTYDSFNTIIPRGNAMGALNAFVYEQLMESAMDEVSGEYGLLAEAVRYPDDFSYVTYRLRENARWHDGKPVTVDDVIWSFDAYKTHDPQMNAYYRNVVKAEKTGEREVTFIFDVKNNRELPQIIGQLTILPKHWWEGTDASGNKRDITKTTLEPPLGSGPYRIKPGFQAGRSITFERVKDYWGKDVPVRIGTHNFDEIRYEYYRDMDVALEAFKADQYDFRMESSAKNWATGYDFPARREGRVALEEYKDRSSGNMQAFAFNLRRAKFQDPRVRRAFDLALNFDDMNRTLFYGQYKRIQSYFEGTELASSGLPEGRELEILETVRGEVPEEVFTTPYSNPPSGAEAARTNLREAVRLLSEAGWKVRADGGKRVLVNEKGEPLNVEFLLVQPNFERVVLFYKPALERLGINVSIRTVDTAQYRNRLDNRDFDIVVQSFPQSLSPGNEQRFFWGSQEADKDGSYNVIGIKNPAVDKLIDRVIFATDRDDLVAASRALDRVLLWNHFVVPQWTSDSVRYAYWKRMVHPNPLPTYRMGFPTIWWADSSAGTAPPPPPEQGAQ